MLEEDIVENIIHVYNNHCTQEDDVLAASLLVSKDNIEKKKISIYPIPNKGIGKAINERLLRAQVK